MDKFPLLSDRILFLRVAHEDNRCGTEASRRDGEREREATAYESAEPEKER